MFSENWNYEEEGLEGKNKERGEEEGEGRQIKLDMVRNVGVRGWRWTNDEEPEP